MKKFNVVVKKKFIDGATGLVRKPGDKMTISEKRYIEIIRKGDYVEIVKDNATAPKSDIKNK